MDTLVHFIKLNNIIPKILATKFRGLWFQLFILSLFFQIDIRRLRQTFSHLRRRIATDVDLVTDDRHPDKTIFQKLDQKRLRQDQRDCEQRRHQKPFQQRRRRQRRDDNDGERWIASSKFHWNFWSRKKWKSQLRRIPFHLLRILNKLSSNYSIIFEHL